MKISLILMAVLFAVVPVLGLSAPSASAEEVVSYPEVINQGDTLYFNPNIVVTEPLTGSISYRVSSSSYPALSIQFLKYYSGSENSYLYTVGQLTAYSTSFSDSEKFPFYFYSLDSSLVGVNLSSFYTLLPDYVFLESDLGRPILLFDSYTYTLSSLPFLFDTSGLSFSVFSLIPFVSSEDSFVGVWGETAEFVGDIFIQVGDLFYDDTAEELTPIGILAVILAGIAVVLLVWNLIRSFLPMRG